MKEIKPSSRDRQTVADFPNLVQQWHPTKNKGLTPDQITAGSHKKVWWKCPKGPDHIWEAVVASRTRGAGCKCCAGKQVSVTNSLATLHPDIAIEWHPTKNKDLTPDQVTAGSNKIVWWKCPKGPDHVWDATVKDRTTGGRNCPYCAGRRVSVTNSLAALYPDVASEWHPTKNKDLTPDQVTACSNKKVWWQCPKEPDHVWDAAVYSRTTGGNGCKCCAGQQVSVTNSLATLHPDVASEWHPTKNKDLTPDQVTAGSGKKVWWKCPKGSDHVWDATVKDRTAGGNGCKCCAGKKVSVTNSLATLHPDVASEWHPTKNKDLTPDQVTAGSGKKVWWICPKEPDHVWDATVKDRTNRGRGCSRCNCGCTVDSIRSIIKSLDGHLESFTQAERLLIFQQAGILKSQGIAKSFIKAASTGRFPEELKKFADGKDSAVNQFISGEITSLENNPELSHNDDITLAVISMDLDKIEDDLVTDDPYSLPTLKMHEMLGALDTVIRLVSMDTEAIDFLIASRVARMWQDAFKDVNRTQEQAIAFDGGEYALRVRNKFLAELREAQDLKIPAGYAFRPKGKLCEPNLMQRFVASQLRSKYSLGNWSGTGSGKTLSAVLASRAIDARLTIICCPNAVVGGSSHTGHGWADEICDIFPDSAVQTKTFTPVWPKHVPHRYLVLNYELFQQPDSPCYIRKLLDSEQIDMVVIDEVHYSKQRTTNNMSRRRELVTALITAAREQNPHLRVLGLSATPVINNLQEGKSLLEMVTGVHYPELRTRATVSNCMKLHQQMVVHGFRWMPDYRTGFEEKRIDIDCSEYIEEIRSLGAGKGSPLALEQILTEARLPTIREHCLPGEKTLIYTYYVDKITERIASALREDGHRVGLYTGDDKTGLESFLHGDLNVLIGSSAIGTGVDGLQRVCDRMIINVLPWTSAEYEQLKGRILRQGQQSDSVTIILPITNANVADERWSWCEHKLNRLHWKKSVADCVVDGVVPEDHLRSPEQVYRDLMDWLERIATGTIEILERSPLMIPLPEDNPINVEKRLARYGDFSKMNQRWNHSFSNKTHERLKKDPEEWYQYHTLYRQARESWPNVPYEEMINWCRERRGFNYEIGDFGCGEAQLADAVSDIHTVHSFDHVAINSNVTSCDMASVPLDDETLDVALFSLSLMGKNFADYLQEAYRTLKLDGHLIIFEPTSRFVDDKGVNHAPTFAKDLEQLGFTAGTIETIDRFTRIQAMKRSRIITTNNPTISFKIRQAK